MYTELDNIELQIIELQKKKEEVKQQLILDNAKFKKDETIMHEIKINGKYYPGGVIEDIVLGGGYTKDIYGNQIYYEHWFCYKFRPFGKIKPYLIDEKELIKKLK